MTERDAAWQAHLLRRAVAGIAALVAATVLFVGWLGLARYINGSGEIIPFGTMAVHAALLFIILSVGVFSIHRDVGMMRLLDAQRRDAGEALRATQGHAQLVIENAIDAVVTMDGAGVITGWNAQAEATFGWTKAEAMGRLLAMTIIPEAYREAHEAGLRRLLTTGEPRVLNRRIELVALHRDQHEFPVEIAITPVSPGSAVGFSAFVRDITAHKRGIAELSASREHLHTQLERMRLLDRTTRAIADRQDSATILAVVLRNLEENMPIDFGCVCFSDVARSLLTVACVGDRSQPLAGTLGMLRHTTLEVDANSLARCLRGELVHEADLTHLDSQFAARFAAAGLDSLVIAPLLVESKVFGVLIAARAGACQFSDADCEFLRQLSEHVALVMHQADLYKALQLAYDDLRETQQKVMQQERLRALGQLASGIAHDINNALSPAALYAQTLLRNDSTLGGEAREYLVIIQRAIEDVASTVARMKEFSRHSNPQMAHAAVDLNLIVDQVLATTHARWHDMPQERGIVIRLSTQTEPGLPQVMGAETELRDGLTNLILNAVDAMPEGGTLSVRTHTVAAGHVAVEVTDTGIGMDEKTRSRCLEPFFTTKGERGTGLGLAMVYGMLERHGGDVEIESVRGRGTTMRMIFPACLSEEEADHAATMTLRSLQPQRLLLIDDDPMVLKSLNEVLLHEGHWVTTADGGESGIDMFRAAEARGTPFSVVITDLGMPHVDGRKVAAAVKAIAPHVPVLLLTGWGHRLLAEGDTPEYVDRVLSKPPKLSELRLALGELGAAQTLGGSASATRASAHRGQVSMAPPPRP